ncbi:MAG: hypothetical protein H8E91_00855 [Planctomycetes bacterium]|nr:hypothetical protein [Planctomycetota bacterium]
MLRFLPILLLVLQSIPFSGIADAAHRVEPTTQKMSCCGGCCRCAANGCQCKEDKQEAPAPAKTPFSPRTIDFAPPISPIAYELPELTLLGEIAGIPTAKKIVASNNCRQALLGRWQN